MLLQGDAILGFVPVGCMAQGRQTVACMRAAFQARVHPCKGHPGEKAGLFFWAPPLCRQLLPYDFWEQQGVQAQGVPQCSSRRSGAVLITEKKSHLCTQGRSPGSCHQALKTLAPRRRT
eukprot:scaffold2004_cov420-Prasinococcus_capsulatus_cf.AAC.5